jgi:hypothetical protein
MWHENRAPLYADGGTADPVRGTLRRRCGVYQPFTIETWIYNSDTNQRERGFRRVLSVC